MKGVLPHKTGGGLGRQGRERFCMWPTKDVAGDWRHRPPHVAPGTGKMGAEADVVLIYILAKSFKYGPQQGRVVIFFGKSAAAGARVREKKAKMRLSCLESRSEE